MYYSSVGAAWWDIGGQGPLPAIPDSLRLASLSYWETEQLNLLAEEVYRKFYELELVVLEPGAATKKVSGRTPQAERTPLYSSVE